MVRISCTFSFVPFDIFFKELDNLQIVGFVSAAGGCGTSVLAAAAAQALAVQNAEPVFYLDLQIWPTGSASFRGPENGRSAEEFLYRLLHSRETDPTIGETYYRKDPHGVWYFCHAAPQNQLRELEERDWEMVLAELLRFGTAGAERSNEEQCRVLILDFPLDGTPLQDRFLQICSSLVLVDDGRHGSRKNRRWLQLQQEKGNALPSVLLVSNGVKAENQPEALQHIVIEGDEESFRTEGEDLFIDLTKEFGTGVKDIAEWIQQQRYSTDHQGTDSGCTGSDPFPGRGPLRPGGTGSDRGPGAERQPDRQQRL